MYHADMSLKDSGGGALGSSRGTGAARSAANAGGFTPSGGVGKSRPYAGLSNNLAAVERRSDPKYRELLGTAAKKEITAKNAMRNRTWKQSLATEAEQAALDATKHGKSLGFSSTEVSHDLRTMVNLRNR